MKMIINNDLTLLDIYTNIVDTTILSEMETAFRMNWCLAYAIDSEILAVEFALFNNALNNYQRKVRELLNK